MAASDVRRALRRWVWPAAVVGLVAAGGCWAGCSLRPGPGGQTLMVLPSQSRAGGVGVVRRTDLLVAYHKGAHHEARYQALVEARDAARAEGDEAGAARVEALGAELQEVAHRQLAGREPLYTVLVGVEDELRAIMAAHGLSRVLEAGPGVEGVDITDELVAALRVERER